MSDTGNTHGHRLDPPASGRRDHSLGDADAPITLVEAFPDEVDFAAVKIGVFIASLVAGGLGTALLWWQGRTPRIQLR